mgnify:CR=1 FL=1
MKKSIQISIPNPCHEDWNKMTPTEKGKHCAVCTKEVFDFTQATDEDLVKLAYAGDNLCGRFRKDQLDREIKLERKSRWNLAPLAASVLLPLSLMANPRPEPKPVESTYLSLGIGSMHKSQVMLTGYIKDKDGQPINDVKLEDLGTGNISYSNVDGSYRLVAASGSIIEVYKEGYDRFYEQLGNYHEQKQVTLNMVLEAQLQEVFPITDLTNHLTGIAGGIKVNYRQNKDSLQTKKDTIKKDSIKPQNVKGVVKDDEGFPLPGVNIVYGDNQASAITDFDGLFEIEFIEGATLKFTYIGYDPVEMQDLDTDAPLEIMMYPNYEMMGDVIIVGYSVVEEPYEHKPGPYMPGNPDRYYGSEQAVNARKQASANTRKYEQIKAERRKAARKNKKKK